MIHFIKEAFTINARHYEAGVVQLTLPAELARCFGLAGL